MGNALCLASLGGSTKEQGGVADSTSFVRVSPVHSCKRRISHFSPSKEPASLHALCVTACARALLSGSTLPAQVEALPLDLLQLVLDHIIDAEQLRLTLLQQLVSPWLHHLRLDGAPGVNEDWVPTILVAQELRCLDLSGCAQLTDDGVGRLSALSRLTELRLAHCVSLSDVGIAACLPGLTELRCLSLDGLDGLTTASLAPLGSSCTALTALSLAQCASIHGAGVRHLTGLGRLRVLSLGWCRELGDAFGDPSNSVAPLSSLTALQALTLAGTRTDDTQLAALAPTLLQLRCLDLSGSAVGNAGLAALAPLSATLTELRLRGCHVGDAGAPALAVLTRLQVLDLACSALGTQGLLSLMPLAELRELVLDMCGVTDEGCRVLRSLTCLERLDLSDTDVGDAGVACLGRCTRLGWLSLCNTEVGDCCVSSLTHLTRLSYLNLDARCVSDASLRLLMPLAPALRELDLYAARITLRGATLLPSFTALQRLDACGGHITDRACFELSKLRQLTHLNISQNRCVSDAGLRALAVGLGHQLLVLNLGFTSVTDAGVHALVAMKALQAVVLSGTAISDAGATRLRRLRPLLEVKLAIKGVRGR